jgi:hypothetical protein
MTRLTTCAVAAIIAAMMAPPALAQKPPDRPDSTGISGTADEGRFILEQVRRSGELDKEIEKEMEKARHVQSRPQLPLWPLLAGAVMGGVVLLYLLPHFLSIPISWTSKKAALIAATVRAMIRGRNRHSQWP